MLDATSDNLRVSTDSFRSKCVSWIPVRDAYHGDGTTRRFCDCYCWNKAENVVHNIYTKWRINLRAKNWCFGAVPYGFRISDAISSSHSVNWSRQDAFNSSDLQENTFSNQISRGWTFQLNVDITILVSSLVRIWLVSQSRWGFCRRNFQSLLVKVENSSFWASISMVTNHVLRRMDLMKSEKWTKPWSKYILIYSYSG